MKSLLVRLLLVVAVAVFPAVAFQAYSGYQARQIRQRLVEDEVLRLVQNVAVEQQSVLEGAAQVLSGIIAAPAVQDGEVGQCEDYLANLLREQPRYINAAVLGLNGHRICGTMHTDTSFSASNRSYFRLALQTGHFAVGEYAVGGATKQPSLHFAKPLRNRDGEIVGVVVVALSLDWLGSQLQRSALPPLAEAALMDRNGTILARYPDPRHTVGQPMPRDNRLQLEGSEVGFASVTDHDGRERIVGYSPPDADPKGLLIAVGLDRAETYAEVTRDDRLGLALIVTAVGLALLVTALLGTRLIRRPFHQLLAASERWREGDLGARSGVRSERGEFGRLGAAFDAMAAALASREQALRTALESTADSVIVLDGAWRITFLNQHAKAIVAPDRDVLGQTLWDAFPALVDSLIGAACRTAMKQGVPGSSSAYLPAFDRELEAQAYPSADGLTVFCRDVTEERRMAADLLQSEELFRATFEHAGVGMAQFALDGRCLRVNDRLCNILDRSREDLVGRQFVEITHPDDREGNAERRRALIAGERTSISAEKRYLPHDGNAIWVNITVSLLRDAEGRPDRFITVVEDISARKHAEAALRESETLLRTVLEQIPVAIAILRPPDGHVSLRSRYCEHLLSLPTGAGVRLNPLWEERVAEHPDGRPYDTEEYPSWRALYRGETVIAEPMLYRRPDGALSDLEVYVAPVRDSSGNVLAAVTGAFDVTERNETRRVLAQSNAQLEARVQAEVAAREAAQSRAAQAERMQALGQLAGGIAHDFNNVLQAIVGAASLIERRAESKEGSGIRRLSRITLEAAERGASITRRLLAFGRQSVLRAETLDVVALLLNLKIILVHTLGAAIDVQVVPEAGHPMALADKGQLETALVNLATNARDAMPKGGRLTLSTSTDIVAIDEPPHPAGLAPGRYVRITIADTGVGMDPETLRRAFEPFFTTKDVGVGTGLGLSMAKGFAEQSGGGVNVRSTPGEGTTVTLWLPEADSAASVEPAQENDDADDATRDEADEQIARAAVLVVDDEDLIRETMAEHLEDRGFRVLTARNGAEALNCISSEETIDVLVTDLSMPGIDGVAVIGAAQARRHGLPAILLTGYAGDGAALAVGGAISGSFSLLRKPVRAAYLVDRIQSLLAARSGTDV